MTELMSRADEEGASKKHEWHVALIANSDYCVDDDHVDHLEGVKMDAEGFMQYRNPKSM